MKVRSLKICLLVFGVFLLAGCHKLEATTKIEPNGSGELKMGVGFSAEERANLEKRNPDQKDFCNTTQAPPNTTITEEQRGDETWCINITRFNDLAELRSLYEQRSGIKINRKIDRHHALGVVAEILVKLRKRNSGPPQDRSCLQAKLFRLPREQRRVIRIIRG